MEKTTHITIASTTYALTEGAYGRLSRYLESLKAHFAKEPEMDEILKDIESRIAEKLLHKHGHVITENDIVAVIGEIGDASEFDDDAERVPPVTSAHRLYRDTDNAWIAGVCAGMAAYFDIDPLWIRLAFLLSIFFGGTGIILYAILWILVPEAQTASQRLEMHGRPVDLEGIARVVKERVEEVGQSNAVRRMVRMIGHMFSRLVAMVGSIIGSLMLIGAFFATVGLLIGTGIIVANWNAPYNDFPLRGVVSESLLIVGLIGGIIAALIPLLAIFAFGLRLVRRKIHIPPTIGFGLIGVWAIALAASGTILVTSLGQYYEHTQTDPRFQTQTRTLEIPSFASMKVADALVTIATGEAQEVRIEGRPDDIERMSITVVDGILTIEEAREPERCLFCSHASPRITVTTPDLHSLTSQDAAITFDSYADTALSIAIMRTTLRGSLDVDDLSLRVDGGSVRADIDTMSVSIDAQEAYIALEGDAQRAAISLDRSSMNADSLRIVDATITAIRSQVDVYVSGVLTVAEERASIIRNAAESHSIED